MSISAPELLKGIVAVSGDKTDIPLNASVSGAADFTNGFPVITGQPIASGGIAPARQDFNGFFNLLSQHTFWQQSGGLYTWSGSLDYNTPSIVISANGYIYFALQASGPGTGAGAQNPDSSTGYWVLLSSLVGTPFCIAAGTADALTGTISTNQTTLRDGFIVSVRAGFANATTTPTFNLTMGSTITGAKTIVKKNLVALAASDIPGSGAVLILQYNSTATQWVLLNVAGSALPADVAYTDVVQAFTVQQYLSLTTLTAGSAVAVDCNANPNCTLTLNQNTTMSAATNQTAGKIVLITIIGASTYTLGWNANYLANLSQALPAAPAAGKQIQCWFLSDGTNMRLQSVVVGL